MGKNKSCSTLRGARSQLLVIDWREEPTSTGLDTTTAAPVDADAVDDAVDAFESA